MKTSHLLQGASPGSQIPWAAMLNFMIFVCSCYATHTEENYQYQYQTVYIYALSINIWQSTGMGLGGPIEGILVE